MPQQPSYEDVHIDRPLTSISTAFFNDQEDFAFNDVFADVPVSNPSDQYWQWNKNFTLRAEAGKRGPGSEAAERGQDLNTKRYEVDNWAVKQGVDEMTVAAADMGLNLRQSIARGLTEDLMITIEKQFSSNYLTSGVWGKDLDGSTSDFTQFDDSSSTPIDLVTQEAVNMEQKTGRRPNVLVMGSQVLQDLRNNSAFIDRIKYTSPESVTTDNLEELLDIDNVVISRAVENTSSEGNTFSGDHIFGTDMLLAYANESPGRMEPSAGYRFVWSEFPGSIDDNGMRVREYRNEDGHVGYTEVESAFTFEVVNSDLGTYFANAVA
jgi:hypothetical protein